LDELIGGGFPEASSILLTGPTGTGKTIFGLQYLYNGAKDYKEPGFMISTEDYPTDFQWNQEAFGWNFKTIQDQNLLVFSRYDPVDYEKFTMSSLYSEIILQVSKVIDSVGVKRVVFDSVSPIGAALDNKSTFRTILYYFSKALKEKGCTTIFIFEKPYTTGALTQYDVEQFIMDGVIELSFAQQEDALVHTLSIRKMKATNFQQARYILEFNESGIKIAP
jgi:KaiC/GvpD/RAD55 family RecA-like ATPase